jgi:hypothetical protein
MFLKQKHDERNILEIGRIKIINYNGLSMLIMLAITLITLSDTLKVSTQIYFIVYCPVHLLLIKIIIRWPKKLNQP